MWMGTELRTSSDPYYHLYTDPPNGLGVYADQNSVRVFTEKELRELIESVIELSNKVTCEHGEFMPKYQTVDDYLKELGL